ncbi:MAG TPA: glutaredoxin domain-containing protein [Allosphingosinicella sp.]|nr:glutaredoxin domain-containing protein [Allosphingosinicella sp.]
MSRPRRATLYRMVLPDHTCPFGVRAKMLLEQNGYEVDDHVLGSREDVDRFKSEQDVTTTPLIFIDDRKIGGSRELERHLAED